MFESIIQECRFAIDESDDESAVVATRKNKHDRSAERVGHLLQTSFHDISRKKLLKTIPHLHHHFEKGHGQGDGEYRTVDVDDLAELSKHAERISQHANDVMRMPGPAHHLASRLCGHVANIHGRMNTWALDNNEAESAEMHGGECAKHTALAKHHKKVALRHGFGH